MELGDDDPASEDSSSFRVGGVRAGWEPAGLLILGDGSPACTMSTCFSERLAWRSRGRSSMSSLTRAIDGLICGSIWVQISWRDLLTLKQNAGNLLHIRRFEST